MKLEEGESLVSARVCDETQHLLLSTRAGKSVRFPVTAVRQFKSRTSTGVRGVRLSQDDSVISMAVLNGVQIEDMTQKSVYLKIPVATRLRLQRSYRTLDGTENAPEKRSECEAQIAELLAEIPDNIDRAWLASHIRAEQFILTITENGYGKRSSAYEYRVTNRGGSGITNIVTSARNGKVVASYYVDETDQIVLITTQGMMIRCPVYDIRIAGRNTQGVRILRTADDEMVISTARVPAASEEELEESQEALEAATEAEAAAEPLAEEAVEEILEEEIADDSKQED
jgi:DNA gyrase subunit A